MHLRGEATTEEGNGRVEGRAGGVGVEGVSFFNVPLPYSTNRSSTPPPPSDSSSPHFAVSLIQLLRLVWIYVIPYSVYSTPHASVEEERRLRRRDSEERVRK